MTSTDLLPTVTSLELRAPSVVGASLAVARRNLLKYLRTPQVLMIGMAQSVLFLVIFRYVFGGAIQTGPVPYVDFLLPGFLATNVLFACSNTTTAVAEDTAAGFTDRLRSLPIPRVSVLLGRSLADTAFLALILVVTAIAGVVVGWRPDTGLSGVVGALALCVAFGVAWGWVFQLLGMLAANAQAAQGMALVVFPLTFVSSAYVPVATMPSGLRWFAEHQPVTAMVDAVRSVCLGDSAASLLGESTAHLVTVALVWTAVILAVAAPLAVARFARR